MRKLSEYTEVELTAKIHDLAGVTREVNEVGCPVEIYTIKMAARRGELRPHKIGRRHLFSIQDVLDWVNDPVHKIGA